MTQRHDVARKQIPQAPTRFRTPWDERLAREEVCVVQLTLGQAPVQGLDRGLGNLH